MVYTQDIIADISQSMSRSKTIQIFLPPLEIQKQIVAKVEVERELVNASKKLVKIYEDKTKSVLEKLYGKE